MSFHTDRLRTNIRLILKTVGLLNALQRIRYLIVTKPELNRRQTSRRKRFLQYKQQYENVLKHKLNSSSNEQKKVLIISIGFPEVEAELGIIKALELAGFTPVVLVMYEQNLLQGYYELAAVDEIISWNDFTSPHDLNTAKEMFDRCQSFSELIEIEYEGVRVGMFAASTTLRKLRTGTLDIESPQTRQNLINSLASAMAATKSAQKIIDTIRPYLALFVDTVYTPEGVIFDSCLSAGIDTISWEVGYYDNSLVLKRYTLKTRGDHPASLSDESWRALREMKWTDSHRKQLHNQLEKSYKSGDWFRACGTQFDKQFRDAEEIKKQIGLDTSKKTVFLFPHILWDASFLGGKGLFDNFEEWLTETVKTACKNDNVNWVIKIHPAHIGKNLAEGYNGEPAEVIVLREKIGTLPPHIFILQAESNISTFSLFELMDYCLTVRGTIGIEAARFGIPVLTAGTGYYDRRGFTIDSESRKQYLERIAQIHLIPRMTPEQRNLAERFAYGTFLLRPFPLESLTLEYPKDKQKDITGNSKTEIHIKSKDDWYNAKDLKLLAEWIKSGQLDFLSSLKLQEKN